MEGVLLLILPHPVLLMLGAIMMVFFPLPWLLLLLLLLNVLVLLYNLKTQSSSLASVVIVASETAWGVIGRQHAHLLHHW